MNIFQFMSDSPFLTFFLVLIVAQCIVSVVKYTARHMNIRKFGWPPKHIDADGDFRETDKDG